MLQKLLARLDNPNPPPFDEHSQEGPKLAAAFLDKDCAGARGLSEVEIATLKEDPRPHTPTSAKTVTGSAAHARSHCPLACASKNSELIDLPWPDFVIHVTAGIIVERGSILSRMRA